MRIIAFLIFIQPFLLNGQQSVSGQFYSRPATKADFITCPHSGHTVNMRSPRVIKPQTRELKKKSVEFIPEYVDVPENFQTTVEFVFDLMTDFISSSVPIYVRIEYIDLGVQEGGGIALAGATPSSFYANFPGAAYLDTEYPVALAEKIAGFDLNSPGQPDLIITINSNERAEFSVTPDSPDIGSKSDLATVLLHEIFHGIGFTANAFYDDLTDTGFISGQTGAPNVYARQLEDNNGLNVLETYPSGTEELGAQLTNNDLYFNSLTLAGENRVKVYAPFPYERSSSIAHLDLFEYFITDNRLMIPFIIGGDINYNPGIAVDMLHDIGWDMTSIVHEPKWFSEDVNVPFDIKAKIITDSGFDTSSFVLHVSTDSFQMDDQIVVMDYDASLDEWSYLLPSVGESFTYYYYFEVDELSGIKRTVPARAQDVLFFYTLGPDETPPIISGHLPLTSIKETDKSFSLEVIDIDDFLTGVDTSSLAAVIRLNGEDIDTIPFFLIEDDFGSFFEMQYDFDNSFSPEDLLEYKIILKDKSINPNIGSLPEDGGYYRVIIEAVSQAITSYVNDFNITSNDFSGVGFTITTPNGFEDDAIHSEHPYQNAGGTNTLDFSFELRVPIIIDSVNALIKFREIVLVETGEPDTQCDGAVCDFMFWDYVIVEGKKLGGTEWLPFLDGYDSSSNSDWLDAYNNEQNGTPDLFRNKTIRMLSNGNFVPGDEVFIRFRLFSDPLTVGWGWAIDDLEIQNQSINTNTLDENYFSAINVFPNPSTMDESIRVQIQFKQSYSGNLTLISNGGRIIEMEQLSNVINLNKQIKTSQLSAGLYYLSLFNEDGTFTKRIVLQ